MFPPIPGMGAPPPQIAIVSLPASGEVGGEKPGWFARTTTVRVAPVIWQQRGGSHLNVCRNTRFDLLSLIAARGKASAAAENSELITTALVICIVCWVGFGHGMGAGVGMGIGVVCRSSCA